MLEDHKRTGAYFNAVMNNRRQFEGKVVLDVGTGSGILAIFAAKAGAKKVYAVEATGMAKFARSVVESNGVRLICCSVQSMAPAPHLRRTRHGIPFIYGWLANKALWLFF